MTTPASVSHPAGRVLALDGLRGLAIATVILEHTAPTYLPGGSLAVDGFFALSAYLITTLLLGEVDRTGSFSFRGFYVRRARRLGPALAAWLVLVAAPASIVLGHADVIAGSTVSALAFCSDLSLAYGWTTIGEAYLHDWSLSVEEQFYFLWPTLLVVSLAVLHRRARRRTRRPGPRTAVAAALVVLLAATALQTWTVHHDVLAYYLPWGHATGLLGGCVVALLARFHPAVVRAVTGTPYAVGSLVVLAAVVLGVDRLGASRYELGMGIGALAVVLLTAHTAVARGGPVVALLELRWLRWLGGRSYALYLCHRTIAAALSHAAPSWGHLDEIVALAAAAVLAEISWRTLEEPVLRRGRERDRARRVAQAGAGATG